MATILVTTTETLSVTVTPVGSPGGKGDAATVAAGTVTTLAPGEDAAVVNAGTPNAAVLNFGIPRGDQGDQGDKGDIGSSNIVVACSDEDSPLTEGAAKVTFRMPYAMTLTGIRASLTTAQTSGDILMVDVNKGGFSILSTLLTINNGEKSSTTATTPAVVSDASLADDAEITVDIDQLGDGTAKGLKLALIGNETA